jgi:hypothetical protein
LTRREEGDLSKTILVKILWWRAAVCRRISTAVAKCQIADAGRSDDNKLQGICTFSSSRSSGARGSVLDPYG